MRGWELEYTLIKFVTDYQLKGGDQKLLINSIKFLSYGYHLQDLLESILPNDIIDIIDSYRPVTEITNNYRPPSLESDIYRSYEVEDWMCKYIVGFHVPDRILEYLITKQTDEVYRIVMTRNKIFDTEFYLRLEKELIGIYYTTDMIKDLHQKFPDIPWNTKDTSNNDDGYFW